MMTRFTLRRVRLQLAHAGRRAPTDLEYGEVESELKVGSYTTSGCSTSVVLGLSKQIADEVGCMSPGASRVRADREPHVLEQRGAAVPVGEGEDRSAEGRRDPLRSGQQRASAPSRSSTCSIAGTSPAAAASARRRRRVARTTRAGARSTSRTTRRSSRRWRIAAGRTRCPAIRCTSITSARPITAARTCSRSSGCGTATTRTTRSPRMARTARRPRRRLRKAPGDRLPARRDVRQAAPARCRRRDDRRPRQDRAGHARPHADHAHQRERPRLAVDTRSSSSPAAAEPAATIRRRWSLADRDRRRSAPRSARARMHVIELDIATPMVTEETALFTQVAITDGATTLGTINLALTVTPNGDEDTSGDATTSTTRAASRPAGCSTGGRAGWLALLSPADRAAPAAAAAK